MQKSMRRLKKSRWLLLVCHLYDKEKYIAHIKTLKHALNLELGMKKVHRIINFNPEAWLQSYINMNTKLRP